MKHIILYAHPNPQNLNNYLKQILIGCLWHSRHEVVPALSLDDMKAQRMGEDANHVKKEKEYISSADHMIQE
ncbi:hypothetical protein [Chryseobacterium sp. JAH]|uniref:hypothetical protein n=1 Tax=Chryseobacterium sp. JAH TaxID=1742858 RepID=UPI0007410297|nr:hypothetical protein [Chryseobacterium sp. JAH]KUJ49734.1 hypothetical protein AR685_17475 [Chryseobacterium sp. JAH]